MISLLGPNLESYKIPNKMVLLFVILWLGVIGVFYAFRSIALFKMAKKQGLQKAFLAWIPMLWLYVACKLVGKSKFFNKPFEKIAVWLTLIFSIAQFLMFAYEFFVWFPVIGNYLAGNELWLIAADPSLNGVEITLDGLVEIAGTPFYGKVGQFVDPYAKMGISSKALGIVALIFSYSIGILNLACIIITVTLYFALFRKYWPSHFVLGAILSCLGLFPIFVFIIRNKEPMEYTDYLRSRYNTYYPNGNPYGGHHHNHVPKDFPPTPFEEFADKDEIDPGDPFAEFSSKDKN